MSSIACYCTDTELWRHVTVQTLSSDVMYSMLLNKHWALTSCYCTDTELWRHVTVQTLSSNWGFFQCSNLPCSTPYTGRGVKGYLLPRFTMTGDLLIWLQACLNYLLVEHEWHHSSQECVPKLKVFINSLATVWKSHISTRGPWSRLVWMDKNQHAGDPYTRVPPPF